MPIVFIHVGTSAPPEYLLDALYQAQLWNREERLVVVLERPHVTAFAAAVAETRAKLDGIRIVATSELTESPEQTELRRSHRLNAHFRQGFWLHATERFFVLENLMRDLGLEDVVHLENDVMLYAAIAPLVPYLRRRPLALTRDAPDRVIAGIVYARDAAAVRAVNAELLASARAGLDDMRGLSRFATQQPEMVTCLPIAIPGHDPMLPASYAEHVANLGGIFDAAAIGQYLGGIDPRNITARRTGGSVPDTTGFVNETCVFSCATIEIDWETDAESGLRRPRARSPRAQAPSWVAIQNLHIHSKQLGAFSSEHRLEANEIVTGERLMALADVCLIPRDILAFHRNVLTFAATPVVFNRYEDLARDHAKMAAVSARRVLFVYTHALEGFFEHVWPRLDGGPYVLITHNSDHAVGGDAHLRLLNESGDKLASWHAQNVVSRHDKLHALPIGIANSMWPHGDVRHVHETAGRHLKDKRRRDLIHVRFDPRTHPERERARRALSHFVEAAAVAYEPAPWAEYLEELAAHEFCACPQGNGIDTHRLWESLYLGTTPIILRSPHTEAWERRGLPVLLVDAWEDVTAHHLENMRERFRKPSREALRLSFYRESIRGPGNLPS